MRIYRMIDSAKRSRFPHARAYYPRLPAIGNGELKAKKRELRVRLIQRGKGALTRNYFKSGKYGVEIKHRSHRG